MRWSQTFIPTLKESPSDAEIASHKLLLRAGLVRKLTGGLYTFLPMGLRALRKIERIIREEMDRAGATEVLMPALQPPDIWQQSGRYESARDVLFKVKDSAGREWVLGPTHEEVITHLAASEISSYRQLPRNFYQVQTKFRDEIRPRFGLMRAKEFIMKDAYSFDGSDAGAMASYQKMYDAYIRIFARCGLKAFPVEADTGVIGGSHSHEFMVPAATGENDVVYGESDGYAANIEKATSAGPMHPTPTLSTRPPPAKLPGPILPTPSVSTGPAPEKFPTPGVVTIEQLAALPHGIGPDRQVKTLVYVADSQPVLVLLRGDDTLNEAKLMARLGAAHARPATPEECASLLGARPGSLGAVSGVPANVVILADEVLRGAMGMVTGANHDGFHLRHVDVDRDIRVSRWLDLRTVKAGEASMRSGEPLRIRRAIEVGHVFKLGTKYSERMNATFLAEDGQRRPCVMGCYGIGVTRTLQAIIEQCHDENGIAWPVSVAPFVVCITPLNATPGGPTLSLAERLHDDLAAAGVEAILDDRDERPGVKFKDSELVGFPLRVGIGEKSLASGEVELKPRNGPMLRVPVATALDQVLAWVREHQAALNP